MNPPPGQAAPVQISRWHPVADAQALRDEACARILELARQALAERGVFRIVLAGGGTPRDVYRALGEAATDWSRWQIWFGDERCLPPDDPERNSRMAHDAWISRVGVPDAQVHPIPAELGARSAADRYAALLAPVGDFDLVLLGLGEDAHTASLFPGQDWGSEAHAPAALPVFAAPKPPPERVSLSALRLSRARAVLFLVAGMGKRDAVRRWRRGEDVPAGVIRPPGGVDVLVEAALLEEAGV